MIETAIIAWALSIVGITAWEGLKLDREYRDRANNGEFDD